MMMNEHHDTNRPDDPAAVMAAVESHMNTLLDALSDVPKDCALRRDLIRLASIAGSATACLMVGAQSLGIAGVLEELNSHISSDAEPFGFASYAGGMPDAGVVMEAAEAIRESYSRDRQMAVGEAMRDDEARAFRLGASTAGLLLAKMASGQSVEDAVANITADASREAAEIAAMLRGGADESGGRDVRNN